MVSKNLLSAIAIRGAHRNTTLSLRRFAQHYVDVELNVIRYPFLTRLFVPYPAVYFRVFKVL